MNPEGKGAHFNRHGRRSGGDRPVRFELGEPKPLSEIPEAALSIQCFERRHHDCTGSAVLVPGRCGCFCHKTSGDARRDEINQRNLNQPISKLICPECESQSAYRDREEHEHPGVFTCGSCKSTFYA